LRKLCEKNVLVRYRSRIDGADDICENLKMTVNSSSMIFLAINKPELKTSQAEKSKNDNREKCH
jgi:hypothetical protein